MDVLNILLSVAALAFAVWLAYVVVLAGLYWLWNLFVPGLVIAIAVFLWRSGHDNLAVLVGIFGFFGSIFWMLWADDNNPAGWIHDQITGAEPDRKKVCPKCRSRDVCVVKETTSDHESTRTATRTIKHYSKNGAETGRSEIEYDAPYSYTSTTRYMACKQCSCTWTA